MGMMAVICCAEADTVSVNDGIPGGSDPGVCVSLADFDRSSRSINTAGAEVVSFGDGDFGVRLKVRLSEFRSDEIELNMDLGRARKLLDDLTISVWMIEEYQKRKTALIEKHLIEKGVIA